ncbi:hypothetical protein B0H65DRAFT_545675 [Neurospora tetraspora]|uniref:Uncharacterized protein n=1 Tax=Neurospora tetraspora TaxID=94610 RepID=A0AAE0JJN4_9PEZI|nr:hypothetical protein B0H65DRAFT_545675 [Neurospora tetraspora]
MSSNKSQYTERAGGHEGPAHHGTASEPALHCSRLKTTSEYLNKPGFRLCDSGTSLYRSWSVESQYNLHCRTKNPEPNEAIFSEFAGMAGAGDIAQSILNADLVAWGLKLEPIRIFETRS